MALLEIKDGKVKAAVFVATALFLCMVAVVSAPLRIPHKLFLPVGLLCVASLWLTPWEITLALLFSAMGDYFGSCACFMAQMGSFAVAHIFYIVFFIRRYLRKGTKMTAKMRGYQMMLGICALTLLAFIFVRVVPAAPEGVLRTGVGIYAVVICVMLLAALVQRSSLYALGALLFVISDFILAWNKFVEPVPYDQILILITYFAAQWLLFVRATPYKVAHPIYLMRF